MFSSFFYSNHLGWAGLFSGNNLKGKYLSLILSVVVICDSLRERCSYSELFWFIFSRIWTEYREIRTISPYSVRMRDNMNQNNYEYGHVLRSDCFHWIQFHKAISVATID